MSRRRPADETASPPRRLQQLLSYQGPVVDVARVPARRGNESAPTNGLFSFVSDYIGVRTKNKPHDNDSIQEAVQRMKKGRLFFPSISVDDDIFVDRVYGHIADWNTSEVTDMSGLFSGASALKSVDLSRWDTSKVTDMSEMFSGAIQFKANLSRWDTSKVTNMSRMFKDAREFNGDISKWDTSQVTNMAGMFDGAHSFDADISRWDTFQVTDMRDMFRNAKSFNGDLKFWEISRIQRMPKPDGDNSARKYMFQGAVSYSNGYPGRATENPILARVRLEWKKQHDEWRQERAEEEQERYRRQEERAEEEQERYRKQEEQAKKDQESLLEDMGLDLPP